MSRFLVDTNILIRLNDPSSNAAAAVRREIEKGGFPMIVPQVLIEYWAVATRPKEANGLGLEPALVVDELSVFQENFELAPDLQECFEEWRSIVLRRQVRGKQAHDAKIVASMIVHGIESILTFNGQDFTRYPEVLVIAP